MRQFIVGTACYPQGGKAERFTTIDGDSDDDDDNMGFHLPDAVTHNVWRRKLLVEGPDWEFGFDSNTPNRKFADDAFALNTYATLVQGVVGVVERTIPMNGF